MENTYTIAEHNINIMNICILFSSTTLVLIYSYTFVQMVKEKPFDSYFIKIASELHELLYH